MLKRTISSRRFFFWLRNNKNNFSLHTLILGPELVSWSYYLSKETDIYPNYEYWLLRRWCPISLPTVRYLLNQNIQLNLKIWKKKTTAAKMPSHVFQTMKLTVNAHTIQNLLAAKKFNMLMANKVSIKTGKFPLGIIGFFSLSATGLFGSAVAQW